jgi:hypothetical protein
MLLSDKISIECGIELSLNKYEFHFMYYCLIIMLNDVVYEGVFVIHLVENYFL